MNFENNKSIKIGEKTGYLLAYFLFTTILFLILKIMQKMPTSWTYLHVIAITILIITTGTLLKRFLR